MGLQTNTFKMERQEYFRILVRNWVQKRWWLYSLIYVLVISLTLMIVIFGLPIRASYIALVIVAVLMPLYYLFWFWRQTGSKENALFYRERSFTITEEFLEATLDDGSMDKIRWQNILYFKKVNGGFLLFISKQQFIYIPNRVFQNDSDISKFNDLVTAHLKKD